MLYGTGKAVEGQANSCKARILLINSNIGSRKAGTTKDHHGTRSETRAKSRPSTQRITRPQRKPEEESIQ
jgi:hypothetical protein